MAKDLITLQRPQITTSWNYSESVSKCKQILYKWKNITTELANELWIAREHLSQVGNPNWNNSSNSKNWSMYCHEIGSQRQVVNRWLKNWFGDEEDLKRLEDEVADKELPVEIELLNEDFTTNSSIPENSVDLILTDPPYPEEFLDLWGNLSEFAFKVLKPSGFLVAYSGQFHLTRVMVNLAEHLIYYWTMAIMLPGATQIVNGRNLMCGWKPVLIYQKPPFQKIENTFYDVVKSPQGEKELHEWQQSEGGVKQLIEIFSKQGDTVVDPFSGAGTFPKVAYEMKRKAIGIEIDRLSYLKSKERIIK